MPGIADQTSHIAWLMARLANNRNRILGLMQRLTGVGPAGSLKPVLFAKFTHWLDEVATAKNEEMGLMTQIEKIERKHRAMRVACKLKRAAPVQEPAFDHPYCNDNAKGLLSRPLLLFLLWYLFMRQRINQKKQGLTVD